MEYLYELGQLCSSAKEISQISTSTGHMNQGLRGGDMLTSKTRNALTAWFIQNTMVETLLGRLIKLMNMGHCRRSEW